MAGDVLLTPLLVGLGVDELSVTGAAVPRVKKALQSLDAAACETLVETVLEMSDSSAIFELSRQAALDHYAELTD